MFRTQPSQPYGSFVSPCSLRELYQFQAATAPTGTAYIAEAHPWARQASVAMFEDPTTLWL